MSKLVQNMRLKLLSNLKLLSLIFVFASFAACQTGKKSPTPKNAPNIADKSPITDGFFQLLSNEPVKLKVKLEEIKRADKPPNFAKVEPAQATGSLRQFINSEQNSRSPFALSNGEYKLNSQTDLPSSFSAKAILQVKDRIIVESDGIWTLFDHTGKKIIHGTLGASGIFADAENFYAADSTGLIFARRLSDGATVFALSLYFGDEYERTFMFRQGQKFLAVSRERELDPHLADTKENSLIEAVDLGEPLKTDRDGLLKSAKPTAHLVRKTKLLLSAFHQDTLVLATQNRIYTANPDLEINKAFTGEFTPLKMSLDEAGQIYLIVAEKERRSLWLLLPMGELVMSFEIPATFGQPLMPPIIGSNRQIYLVGTDKILAVKPDGKLAWENSPEKTITGATGTTNDLLLVSAGNELLAFDAKGQKRTVLTVSEAITTSPILTKKTEILLASSKYLYRFVTP